MTRKQSTDKKAVRQRRGKDEPATALDRLEAKLLAIGGTRLVCVPDADPKAVVERGQQFDLSRTCY